MDASNPFAAFCSSGPITADPVREKINLSHCIERIFLITLDDDLDSYGGERPESMVFLGELSESLDKQEWLDINNMSQAMFERTLMSKYQLTHAVLKRTKNTPVHSTVTEARVFTYLAQCYIRACKETGKVDTTKCKQIITQNASTCLRQPDLYADQSIESQMIELMFIEFFGADAEVVLEFLEETFTSVVDDEDFLTLSSVLHPLLSKIHEHCTRGMLGRLCADREATDSLKLLSFFTRNQSLAEVLLAYTNTTKPSGMAFEKTLFGTILSSSPAPNNLPSSDSNDLFSNPSRMSQSDVDRAESVAFNNSSLIINCVSELFLKLCRLSSRTKHLLLRWIGRLLHANAGRVKLASTMSTFGSIPRDESSDGLMLNLCSVLVRLCQPFSQPRDPKLLKIRPQYCRQQFLDFNDQEKKHHHASGIPDETFMVPLDQKEVDEIEMPAEYGFICDLFFLTHQALHLGLHSTFERFINLNRDLNRLQAAYERTQGSGAPNADAIKNLFESAMRRYMGMRMALVDPELLKPVLRFHIATSTYLTYLATSGDNSKPFTPLTFPLADGNWAMLGCMPEYVLTCITDAMSLTRRFKEAYFQELLSTAGCFMDLILVFMGSKKRLKNPHLRAKLAEVLFELMPKQSAGANISLSYAHELLKERLFTEHPNIDQLPAVLFDVFVSIETTGESVEFEQKLNYRQPMYKVIDFIWNIKIHKRAIMQLSEAALVDIENTEPPLFLKFVNLLVNDANFLLDEALDYMKQIREKETEREARSMPLTGQELQQLEANLTHMSMLARFHNSAAVDTTHTLALLTSNCSQLFCHSIMVDRICAMLNYFLLKLTGPQMKEFKVKDFDKYEFKPSVIVSKICRIYINLSDSDDFCRAVSADGRSYSARLFPQAEKVLNKIHESPEMIQQFQELAVKIQSMSAQNMEDDDLVNCAPEEFLDPIMGTLMKEPVLLPSSKQVVDKSTIARHILSDQNDPFNRSPLALDQVIPDVALKDKIQAWVAEQRNK